MAQKVTIEPVTRVEGHGKVTIQLDDNMNVTQSRLHIVEFRGFERFVRAVPTGKLLCSFSAFAVSAPSVTTSLLPKHST